MSKPNTFNRTTVELKRTCGDGNSNQIAPFNRTTVELKLWYSSTAIFTIFF